MDEECKNDITEIKTKINEIHNKLFVGNSQPPITVQLDRLNSFKKFSYWFFGAVFLGGLSLAVRLIYGLVTKP